MNINIYQKSLYQGDNWWKWSVWLDGTKDELDQVESVKYILHPTFPNPVITVSNRKSKFRLNSGGWGQFMIYAEVNNKNGEVHKLDHWLKLEKPLINKKSKKQTMKVFISSGIADKAIADSVRQSLTSAGVVVVSTDDIRAGQPVESAVSSLIEDSSSAIVIVSDKGSPWVNREIAVIKDHKIPLTQVIIGSGKSLKSLSNVRSVHIKDIKAVESGSKEIIQMLKSNI